ncbi:MAG: hypothetical protein JRJ38_10505 [Deltaproteobacteria bacterium]|nr:hypothetical protein [Deltaproteobacteria bacterium]
MIGLEDKKYPSITVQGVVLGTGDKLGTSIGLLVYLLLTLPGDKLWKIGDVID